MSALSLLVKQVEQTTARVKKSTLETSSAAIRYEGYTG